MDRFAADHNFHEDILRGLLRRLTIDVVPLRDAGLASAQDPAVLDWAAAEGRVLLTHDRNTVPGYLYDRLRRGLSTPGVIVVDDQAAIGRAVEDLFS
ncbi:MAG TPA: DUF5615 family PIN-like protein, partial [Planctomycetaceae bacterium]